MRLHTRETGSPYYKEHRVKNTKLKSLRAAYRALDLIKENFTKAEILDILIAEDLATESTVPDILIAANNVIDDEFCKDHKTVLGLHLTRYNKEIEEVLTLIREDYLDFQFIKHRIAACASLINIMYAKEKLLQLHNHSSIVKLTQKNITINKNNSTPQVAKESFNLDELSFDECVEFLRLIDKSIRSEDDEELFNSTITTVTQVQKQDENKTIDVEVEVTNIDKIQKVEKEEEKGSKTYTALIDVKQRMLETFQRIAQEKFKQSNAGEGPTLKDFSEK